MGTQYYDSTILLEKKDIDGLEPSIYMITTNRSAGKTTDLLIKSLKLFKHLKRKTILIYRHQYELSSASTIYTSVLQMYPELGKETTTMKQAEGLYVEIFLDGESMGYAVSLNNVDAIKKYSGVFSEVDICIMDEFQLENGKYLKNEVEKLQSLAITIARGGGKQSRPIKIFLLGNDVSMLNPYFIFFDVSRRKKVGTKYIRGHGWIAEFLFNESASNAIKANGIYRAFSNSAYMEYSTNGQKLYNEDEFMEKSSGKLKYLFTIKHNNKMWGVREELQSGKVFITEHFDQSSKNILTFSSGEHSTNTVMLSKSSFISKRIKDSYQLGLLRFSNLNAKNVIYDILALDFTK